MGQMDGATLRAAAEKLSALTGLPYEEIVAALREADVRMAGWTPEVKMKGITVEPWIADALREVLGDKLADEALADQQSLDDTITVTLDKLVKDGHVEVGQKRQPKTVESIAAQARARERARKAEEWKKEQQRRNAYRGWLGGPEDGQRRRKQLAAMSRGERRATFEGDLAEARAAAYEGYVTR
jgi:hypothetical protein